jgi:hypothetical protein
MSQYTSAGVSPRSILIAGVSAAIVGAAAVTPVSVPDFSPAKIASAVEMASITTPLEVAIKNTYNFVEPWAAYGAAWGQYVLGLIPGLWWVAPGVPFAYYTAEPLVQAGVYTFADVVGLNFAQIGPDINAGITTSINNGINYGLAWLNSLVPFPPVPPIPPLPGASVAAGAAALPAAATAAADLLAAPEATSITTPIEDAIKNTYNVVEPWAAYGAELTQYVLGFIPGLWWVAPGVDLAYFTIEPLVQAGVYTLADVIGLNFAQIGPDISTGVETSISNAVTYGLAWLNSLVPLPPLPPFPPFPGAAVDAGTVSVPAAAAVQTAALEADATIAGTSEAPVEKAAPVLEAVPAEAAPVTEAETEAPAAPAEDAPAADAAAPAVQAPAVEVEAVEATIETEATAETDVAAEAEVAAEVSAPAEAPGVDDQAAETAAPADSPTASGADTSDNTERPSRAARSATRG